MKTRLTKLLVSLCWAFAAFAPILYPISMANAGSICDMTCKGDANDIATCEEIKKANGCSNSTDTLQSNIVSILNAVIGISGLVAVIFVIIGGINYITAAGDVSKIKKAKDTILYACIGLIICALAFAIVNWVIGTALGQGTATSTP